MSQQPLKPEIEYPCQWRYRVLGEDADTLRALIGDVLSDRPHEIKMGNVSSKGTYCSVEGACEVLSEADRDRIFQALASAEGVKAVV